MDISVSCQKCKKGMNYQIDIKQIQENIGSFLKEKVRCSNSSCGNEFNVVDGFVCFPTADSPFIQYLFNSNKVMTGLTEITPGIYKLISLDGFSRIHKVFLNITSGKIMLPCQSIITREGFSILSSKYASRDYPDKIKISWLAYGNKLGTETSLWRSLLSNAKQFEIEGNARMEIVELETAFEVFLSNYLKPILEHIISPDITEKVFKQIGRRPGDLTGLVFQMVKNCSMREYLEKAGRIGLYQKWQRGVKEMRDGIVHRGRLVSLDEAKEAFKTVFEIFFCLDPLRVIEECSINSEITFSNNILN